MKKLHLYTGMRFDAGFTKCGKRTHLIDARLTSDVAELVADPAPCKACLKGIEPAAVTPPSTTTTT